MSTKEDRRRFLQGAGATIAAATVAAGSQAQTRNSPNRNARDGSSGNKSSRATPPLSVASGNGLAAVAKAGEVMRGGGDTLDAVLAGVKIVELDPADNSVGYGGLPNEMGVVELDASVMHEPTRRAGAVASLRGVKTPSEVARLVMERTDHILIVGEGARAFATAHGFPDENLLTPESRLAFMCWKETYSANDKWGASPYRLEPASPAGRRRLEEIYGKESAALARHAVASGSKRGEEELLAWADEVARRRQGRSTVSPSTHAPTSAARPRRAAWRGKFRGVSEIRL